MDQKLAGLLWDEVPEQLRDRVDALVRQGR